MAQDPNQAQPGAEANANDVPMSPQSTSNEIDIAVAHYMQMKEGIDHRIAAYTISRQELSKKRPRSLIKWAKENCESVVKLLQQKGSKEEQVELLMVAIKKQRVLDLRLLKMCRDGSIISGVPANLLPWNYGELEDPASIGNPSKDQNKTPAAANGNGNGNGNGSNNDNGNGNGSTKNDNNDKDGNKKADDDNMVDRINAAIANLHKLKTEAEAKHGKSGINTDKDDSKQGMDIQVQNKKLKRDVVNRMKGYNQVKAKHVQFELDSDASLDGGLDDILSDSDDDTATADDKAEQRAEVLIAKIASKEGCSYPAAMQLILDNPQLMQKAGVSRSKFKRFSLDCFNGRDKFKKKLFEETINGIGYQQQLRNVLEIYFGPNLTLKNLVKNWSQYEWPFEIILLYVYQIGDFELNKLKDCAKSNKKRTFDESRLKFFEKERELMKHIFIDNLLINKNKDLRSYVLQSLEYVLNKERNKKNKLFSLVYEKDRGSLISDSNKVKENYIFNYNNKVALIRKGIRNNNNNRPLVSFSSSNNNNNNNNNNDNGELPPICPHYNSTRGCNFGRLCNKRNICIECKNGKHGVTSCYKVARRFIDNGTIQRIMERRIGVQKHDPRNGVIIGVDGKNYYLNQFPQGQGFNDGYYHNNNNNNRNGNRNNNMNNMRNN